MRRVQTGFTLVELVVVIVILGILAATALPRFINLTTDARQASINGLAGGLRSAVAVVQARYMATGNLAATTVTMVDTTVVTVNAGTGIPTAEQNGIGRAVQSTDGFTPTWPGAVTGTAVFQHATNGAATCQATYDGTSGAVVVTTTTC